MSNNIELNINNFNGPLDLLLELVRDKQMDIFDIDLSELATEYVRLIDKLKDEDIDLASEYLVMAASLIQLKAKMILESPEQKQEIEQEKGLILKQLVEHQQFKLVAEELRKKELSRKNFFIKETDEYERYEIAQDESRLDGSSDAVKLIMQMRKMFERINAKQLRETTIEKFNLSPAERRLELIKILNNKPKPAFEDLFSVPTINHFVVTMLTILDMARKQELIIKQNEQFGIIEFSKGVINE